MATTDNREPPESFIAKFQERWPEWGVAIAFISPGEREALEAWLALLQEFADAAWGGSQAAPGLTAAAARFRSSAVPQSARASSP